MVGTITKDASDHIAVASVEIERQIEAFVEIAPGGRIGVLTQERRIASHIGRIGNIDRKLAIKRKVEKRMGSLISVRDRGAVDMMALGIEKADACAGLTHRLANGHPELHVI